MFGEQAEARNGNPTVFPLSFIRSLIRHFHGYPSRRCLGHLWSLEETRERIAVSEGPQPITHNVERCDME